MHACPLTVKVEVPSTDWPVIRLDATTGLPPELCRFTYALKGLYVDQTGEMRERDLHVLEINLSLDYPRHLSALPIDNRIVAPPIERTALHLIASSDPVE